MNQWYQLFFIASAAIVGFASDLAARQKAIGDSGGFWERVTRWTCLWLGSFLLLITPVLHGLPALSKYAPGNSTSWLFIIFSLWLVVLCIVLIVPQPAAAVRWLAGSAGFSRRRFWIAAFAVVFVPAMYAGLEPWPEPNYAANWALATLLSISLLYTAFSVPASKPAQATLPETEPAVPPRSQNSADWIAVMRAEGIDIETLRTIAPEQPKQATDGAQEWQHQLETLGSYGIGPELLEPIRRIIQAENGNVVPTLILAADHSGQQEALAFAAAELSRSSGEATLIITPSDHVTLAESLRKWIPSDGGTPVVVETAVAGSRSLESADICVVDIAGLSDQLLFQFQGELDRTERSGLSFVHRIGLVVWWDTHRYSGVRAGNVWAISRRLARIMDRYGSSQARVLIFARLAAHPIAETSAFVGHLLPYSIARKDEVRVPARAVRPVQVHRSNALFTRIATASVRHGFSTAADGAERSEVEANIGPAQVDGKPLRDRVGFDTSPADVRLLQLTPSDVLAVPELIVTGGRSGNSDWPHHVLLMFSANPYIDFVFEKYRKEGTTEASCYLVGAQGRSELIQRHIRQALQEKKDTLAGLVSVFRWDESMLAETLAGLASRGLLHRAAVRYLDQNHHLKRDFVYSSLEPHGAANQPLETVSTDLVEVRDPAVAGPGGLHLRVDRARVAIEAYPGRVFIHNGRRYRIKNWSNVRTVDRVECTPEDLDVQTWRLRNSRLRRLSKETPLVQTTGGLRRFAVAADYREELTGFIEQSQQGPFRAVTLVRPEYTEFSTRALVLAPAIPAEADALYVLTMALRHLLPVHIGVDEGYLEVVRLTDAQVEGEKRISGMAIVDLLPGGGIGLIDAIEESDALVRTLLSSCWSWLTEVAKRRDSAEALFAPSPIAAATGNMAGFRLTPAIQLLSALTAERAVKK